TGVAWALDHGPAAAAGRARRPEPTRWGDHLLSPEGECLWPSDAGDPRRQGRPRAPLLQRRQARADQRRGDSRILDSPAAGPLRVRGLAPFHLGPPFPPAARPATPPDDRDLPRHTK